MSEIFEWFICIHRRGMTKRLKTMPGYDTHEQAQRAKEKLKEITRLKEIAGLDYRLVYARASSVPETEK